MSERSDHPVRSDSFVHDAVSRDTAPTVKARDDVDGCGCLECRNIETTTTNRTVLDALVWSIRLFRSYPSIVGFAGVIILANRILETGSIDVLPTPVIDVFEALTAFAFVVLIRAYAGTIVAGELTGDPVTMREGLHRSLARIPALVGVILLLVFSIMMIPSLLTLPLLLIVGVFPGNPVEVVGFPALAAVVGIVFVLPFLLLVFKFWFAPEACVIGQYGPIGSLRVSWRITTNYRGKFVLIGLIAIGSVIGLSLPGFLPETATTVTSSNPVLRMISSSVGELLSVVWASAYAHIYVQEIVS